MAYELEALLSLDGTSFEIAAGYVVEFKAQRTDATRQRPHGISYALVFRAKAGGPPLVRFDNAHAVPPRGGRFAQGPEAFDHWHRTERDKGQPYPFSTAAQLLADFWREVKQSMQDRGIPNDL